MALYSEISKEEIYQPEDININRIRFTHNDPKLEKFEDLKFCRCAHCEADEIRDLSHFVNNGVMLDHGNKVTIYEIVRSFEVFLETFEQRQGEYVSSYEALGIGNWHIILLMHDGMHLCAGIGQLDTYSHDLSAWYERCPVLDRSICWVPNKEWNGFPCVCKKWCRYNYGFNAKSLQLYKESCNIDLSRNVTINHSLIYHVNVELLHWLVNKAVTGPHTLSTLAGVIAQSKPQNRYTGTALLVDYEKLKRNREMRFLSKDEIEFSMFLQDHAGKKLMLQARPASTWSNDLHLMVYGYF